MSYNYLTEKHKVFQEDNQMMFIKIKEHIELLHQSAGVCTLESAVNASGVTGSSFTMLACVDRLAELGEVEIFDHPVSSSSNLKLVFPTRR